MGHNIMGNGYVIPFTWAVVFVGVILAILDPIAPL